MYLYYLRDSKKWMVELEHGYYMYDFWYTTNYDLGFEYGKHPILTSYLKSTVVTIGNENIKKILHMNTNCLEAAILSIYSMFAAY